MVPRTVSTSVSGGVAVRTATENPGRLLGLRHIHPLADLFVENAPLAHVSHHADDRHPRPVEDASPSLNRLPIGSCAGQ